MFPSPICTVEVPLSSTHLTHAEATGETRLRYGLGNERHHQPGPMPVEPWSVRYVHPGLRSVVPAPSARRPGPRQPPMAAA